MARQEKKFNYIYKITCNVTNRYYIGMHSTDNLDDGYFGSGKRLWFSINYHGKDNHIKEILECFDTRQELKDREKELITKELVGEDLCMNLKEGGDGGLVNEEHRLKFINAGIKYRSLGNKKLKELYENKEWCESLSKKIKEGQKESGYGFTKSFKGKSHTNESKKLMSESSKGMGVGKTNSQYGTCWITKNGLNKKINKEEIVKYQQEGWIKGRK